MSFGDVCLLFGTLLSLGIALPGLLVAWSLLCPRVVGRARVRLGRTPGRCLALGIGVLAMSLVTLGVLFRMGVWPGVLALCGLLAGASVGAAGLAALMGERIRHETLTLSPTGALLRGAVALELAAVVPLLGWFVVLPVAAVGCLGAATFALLGWLPRQQAHAASPLVTPLAPEAASVSAPLTPPSPEPPRPYPFVA